MADRIYTLLFNRDIQAIGTCRAVGEYLAHVTGTDLDGYLRDLERVRMSQGVLELLIDRLEWQRNFDPGQVELKWELESGCSLEDMVAAGIAEEVIY